MIAGLLLATLASCGESPAPTAAPGTVAIVGARLIDGTGADPMEDSVVVIQDARIQAAGPRSSTPVPAGAEVVDGAGKTIIPGLVDTHAHYHGDLAQVDRQFKTQLYFGVTTARSIGADPPEKVAKMHEARDGKILAPRMYTAGLGFTHPKGNPSNFPVNKPATEEEARQMVQDLAAQKVDFIKIWVSGKDGESKIAPNIRAAVVDEALKLNIVPVIHIGEEADFRQFVSLGVKDFLHTVHDTAAGPEFIQLCLDNGVSFSPTLTHAQSGWDYVEHPELLEDPEIRAAFEPEGLARWSDPKKQQEVLASPDLKDRKASFQESLEFVKKMADAGIRIAVGTDSGASTWNVPMGWGTHRELQLLVDAGFTPLQAIVAGTRNGAELMSQGEADYGTLQAGKAADLIVLNADPLADIKNARKIDRVMQAGKWLNRAELLPMP
jgi:imidazolonepropionase-like amidohydrolase